MVNKKIEVPVHWPSSPKFLCVTWTHIGILQSWETMVTCSELRNVLSRAWSLGKIIWRIGCYPSSRSPLSTLLKWSSGKARANTTGSSNITGVGRTTWTAFGTPAPDSASKLTPEAFSISGYTKCPWFNGPTLVVTYSVKQQDFSQWVALDLGCGHLASLPPHLPCIGSVRHTCLCRFAILWMVPENTMATSADKATQREYDQQHSSQK